MRLRAKLLSVTFVIMCLSVLVLTLVFQLKIPEGSAHVLRKEYSSALKWTIGIFLILTVVLVAFVSITIIRRIRLMERHAEQIAHGIYDSALPVKGHDELSTLASTLNYLSTELAKQEQFRVTLMQDIAHELRTPLATLKSHIEAFLDGVWEPTPSRLQSCIEEIERFQALIRSVETMHDADTSVSTSARNLDLRQIVRSVCNANHPRCDRAGLTLSLNAIAEPVWVVADPNHVSQITWNLLDNAIKYTPSGGNIEVSAIYDNGTPVLQVSDTGIGITKDELGSVFERFHRVDKSRNRKTGGSGLGLAIVKQLVSVSNGTITLTSRLGQGTTVRVTWQRAVS